MLSESSRDSPVIGPLDGLIVLELASYITGPYAGMLLGMLGAEVIKIEVPQEGDPFRSWGDGKENPSFYHFNRSKKSVALDLKRDSGRKVFMRLVEHADVIIENFRPHVVHKLGIDYESLRGLNEGLIYCSVSGFGQTGPYKDKPSFDTVGQAFGGLLGLLTDFDTPKLVGPPLSDTITGLFACLGILSALVSRERTGEGQKIETSMLEATIALIGEQIARFSATGVAPRRGTRPRISGAFAFVGSDGLPFVIHLSSPEKFWSNLIEAIEMPELAKNQMFSNMADRIKNYDELRVILADIFDKHPRDYWLAKLEKHDVPCAPIYGVEELNQDPQVKHLGAIWDMSSSKAARISLVNNPLHFSRFQRAEPKLPPRLGEHTNVVLAAIGVTPQTLEELSREGVI